MDLSINLIEYMKLFIYQNNWNFLSITKIYMQELNEIKCKFMRERVTSKINWELSRPSISIIN